MEHTEQRSKRSGVHGAPGACLITHRRCSEAHSADEHAYVGQLEQRSIPPGVLGRGATHGAPEQRSVRRCMSEHVCGSHKAV